MKRFLAILGIALCSLPACADDLGTANSFNAFIFGNASSPGGHADGAVAVGGNWSMEYNTTMQPRYGVVTGDSKVGIYVGGNLTVKNNPKVLNGANVHVKGTYNGGLDLSSGGTFSTNVSSTLFTDQKTYSLNQSSALKALGGEVINTSDPNNLNINASTQSGNTKVYKIDASQLTQNRTLDISGLTAADTLIINVTGTSVSDFGLTLNNKTNSGSYNKILWNFADATYLNISNRAIHGSILAAKASVDQRQNIDGTLIANSWTVYNSVEIHSGSNISFNGYLPPAVPEPAFYQLSSLLVLGGAGVLRLRRKSSKR